MIILTLHRCHADQRIPDTVTPLCGRISHCPTLHDPEKKPTGNQFCSHVFRITSFLELNSVACTQQKPIAFSRYQLKSLWVLSIALVLAICKTMLCVLISHRKPMEKEAASKYWSTSLMTMVLVAEVVNTRANYTISAVTYPDGFDPFFLSRLSWLRCAWDWYHMTIWLSALEPISSVQTGSTRQQFHDGLDTFDLSKKHHKMATIIFNLSGSLTDLLLIWLILIFYPIRTNNLFRF